MGYESDISNDDLVLRTDADGVAVLTLNAPKSINALSEAMLAAMSDTFDTIAKDRTKSPSRSNSWWASLPNSNN